MVDEGVPEHDYPFERSEIVISIHMPCSSDYGREFGAPYFEQLEADTTLELVGHAEIQEVAVGEVEVGDAVGGSKGQVFTDSCP